MPEPFAIVIGAGPAGLAVGACLSRTNVPFMILEKGQTVAASWRRHYDRLHLHTNKGSSALPFMPFPKSCPRYPSRDQVVAYAESYARTFKLDPRFNEDVVSARRSNGQWKVQTGTTTYHAPHVVVATGLSREPIVPQWPGQDSYRGSIVHSRDYRNGSEYTGARVLVVGIGNSGAEIALDLHERGAQPTIAVRGPVNVLPRDILGVPVVVTAQVAGLLPPPVADTINAPLLRVLLGNLRPFGLQPPPYGSLTQIARTGKIPLIDVGTIALIKTGQIAIRPGIDHFVENGVVFNDGRREAFDTVVLATGYRAGLDRILEVDGLLDEQGNPRRDVLSPPDGLHLCGFMVVANGLLNRIGREARRIAAEIARSFSVSTRTHDRRTR
jgi:cation diffusion facilitator CzcD-associated flavoprotein CzcO